MRVVPRLAASALEPCRKLRRRILARLERGCELIGPQLRRTGESQAAAEYSTALRAVSRSLRAPQPEFVALAGGGDLGHRGLGQGLEHFEQEVVFGPPVSVSVEVQDDPMAQGRKSQLPNVLRADVQPPLHQRPDAPA